MKQSNFRFLPLIIILFSVVGVLSWYAKNQEPKPETKSETINPSNLESENLILSPTPDAKSFFFSDDSENELLSEPSLVPSTSEVADSQNTSADGENTDSPTTEENTSGVEPIYTTTTTTRTCTPVYGMADTCTEHIVVDTGAESAVAYSLSAFSYLAGLVAFVKSKKA